MKWIIILTICSFFIVIFIILKGLHDAKEFEETMEKSLHNFTDEDVFSDLDEENEFGVNTMISDETIKIVSLRNRLDKIEEERETKIDSVNIDYQNYEGK